MTKNLIILTLSIALCSCDFLSSESGQENGFYENISGWDNKHIPIIPPFKASSTYPDKWLIGGSDEFINLGKDRYGSFEVETFGVSKNFVYGITPPEHAKDVKKWFLFNTDNLIYAEYLTESELMNTLEKYQLDTNPIKSCQVYFKELTEGKRCYWFPKQGEQYPEFKPFRPDSCIEIHVKGDESGIDFQIKDEIKRFESKIYYFKMKYDKEDNALFYVSFNHSSPILIKDDQIIPAYAWDNNMSIAVYTPYPVGQEKGIKEEDRIVVSKTIKLKE